MTKEPHLCDRVQNWRTLLGGIREQGTRSCPAPMSASPYQRPNGYDSAKCREGPRADLSRELILSTNLHIDANLPVRSPTDGIRQFLTFRMKV